MVFYIVSLIMSTIILYPVVAFFSMIVSIIILYSIILAFRFNHSILSYIGAIVFMIMLAVVYILAGLITVLLLGSLAVLGLPIYLLFMVMYALLFGLSTSCINYKDTSGSNNTLETIIQGKSYYSVLLIAGFYQNFGHSKIAKSGKVTVAIDFNPITSNIDPSLLKASICTLFSLALINVHIKPINNLTRVSLTANKAIVPFYEGISIYITKDITRSNMKFISDKIGLDLEFPKKHSKKAKQQE